MSCHHMTMTFPKKLMESAVQSLKTGTCGVLYLFLHTFIFPPCIETSSEIKSNVTGWLLTTR